MTDGPRTVSIDVTNTLAARSVTGIQRVTVELIRRSDRARDYGFRIEPIVHDEHGWRRLSPGEREGLLIEHVSGPADRIKDRLGDTALGPRLGWLRRTLRRSRPRGEPPSESSDLRRRVLEPGDLFFDCDASWHTMPRRADLLRFLRHHGVQTVLMGHDVLPFERPDWFVPDVGERFRSHVAAHLRAGSLVVCISDNTRRRLTAVATGMGIDPPDTLTIELGCDGPRAAPLGRGSLDVPDRYLLCVGTIEPRKNHMMLLDAWDQLVETRQGRIGDEVGLVVVGRLGWASDAVAARLRALRTRGVRWHRWAGDSRLAGLYQHAAAVLMPSLDEGLGIPVLEARRDAVPVVASDRGGLVEALGSGGVTCDPEDSDEWARTMDRLLSDDDFRAGLVRRSAADPPPTWDDAATRLWSLMRDRYRPI